MSPEAGAGARSFRATSRPIRGRPTRRRTARWWRLALRLVRTARSGLPKKRKSPELRDEGELLGEYMIGFMERTGLSPEQTADVLRIMARNLVAQAARGKR